MTSRRGAAQVGDELAVALAEDAVDDDRLDVRDVGGADHRRDRVDDRRDVDGRAVDDHEVGLLARGDRARPIGDPGDLRAVDRRPAQASRAVIRSGVAVFPSRSSSHDAWCRRPRSEAKIACIWVNWSDEAVVATSELRPDRDAQLLGLLGRRPAVAHLELDLRRQRDVAAGVADQQPLLVGAGASAWM